MDNPKVGKVLLYVPNLIGKVIQNLSPSLFSIIPSRILCDFQITDESLYSRLRGVHTQLMDTKSSLSSTFSPLFWTVDSINSCFLCYAGHSYVRFSVRRIFRQEIESSVPLWFLGTFGTWTN